MKSLTLQHHTTRGSTTVSNSEIRNLVAPTLLPKKDTHPVHRLFAYPAKFQSHLPTSIIERLTSPNALICDPYSGGGTTAASAMLLGRNSFAMDLNPISIVVSRAKTTLLSPVLFEKSLAVITRLAPITKKNRLTADEWNLMGIDLGSFTETIWELLVSTQLKGAKDLIAAILIKRVKLACRRDKEHLRKAPFKAHIEYLVDEIESFYSGLAALPSEQIHNGKHSVVFGSNHDIPLKAGSADLVITSPPYPHIDIEYNLIQIQRRDLQRCFRSNLAQRIAEELVPEATEVSKKLLCNGGTLNFDYWHNTSESFREISRVLKRKALCFVYIGLSSTPDRSRFVSTVTNAGLTVFDKLIVPLGKERVASSRGLYHGRETSMLKNDLLYVLEKE